MLETTAITLDIILIVAALWMLQVVRKASLGGTMGRTLFLVTGGTLLLGFAHSLETILFEFFGLGVGANEVIHRIIVLAGFVLLTYGMRPIAKLNEAAA